MKLLLTSKLNPDNYQTTKPVFLRDTKLTGFAIKVNPSGFHKYTVEYRDGSGRKKTKRISIGSTSSMSVPEARDRAKTILANKDNVPVKAVKTIEELLDEYLSAKSLKEYTAKDYRRTLNQLFQPLSRPINEITNVIAKDWYLSLKSTPTQADRCYRVINSLYNYALQMSYIDTNPFIIIKTIRYKPTPKSGYLEAEHQLPRFWKALNNYQGRATSNDAVKMIQMYLLTGMRKGEIYKAKVSGEYVLVEDTKNGSNLLLPIVPLMPIEILSFPTLPNDIRHVLSTVCNNANVPVMSLHDLRRTTASLCVHLGIGLADIKKLLNHSTSGDVTLSHYVQYRADYLLPVMKKLESYYVDCMTE